MIRTRQRGFTLIELMITVAIIGILAAIAIPTYILFVNKSKRVEAHLAVDKIVKNIKIYSLTRSDFPPTAAKLPAVPACATGTNKTLKTPVPVWEADPGWKALSFHLDEPGYYQYQWDRVDAEHGTITVTGDLDCDTVVYNYIVDVESQNGNVFQIFTFESPND